MLDLLVVGAGFSGIYMLQRARALGLRAQCPDDGRVWHQSPAQ